MDSRSEIKQRKSLRRYCLLGDMEAVTDILREDPSLITVREIMRDAVYSGNVSLIKFLLSQGAKPTGWEYTEDGMYAEPELTTACARGQVEIVRVLLEHGYDVNDSGHRDAPAYVSRKSPLLAAASSGNPGICRLLLEFGADPTYRDAWGRSALHWAANRADVSTVEVVLQNARNVSETDDEGTTPLHIAAARGKSDVVRLLIKNGAEINAKDNHDHSPLDRAFIERGSWYMKKRFLKLVDDRNYCEVIETLKRSGGKYNFGLATAAIVLLNYMLGLFLSPFNYSKDLRKQKLPCGLWS